MLSPLAASCLFTRVGGVLLGQMNLDTADGVGPVSVAGEHGSAGLGVHSRPDSTPPTGGGVGRLSGGVPGESGRDPIDAAFPADREHGGVLRIRTADELEVLWSRCRGGLRKRPAALPRSVANQALLGTRKFQRPEEEIPRESWVTSVRDCPGWIDLLSPHFNDDSVNLTGTYSDSYGESHGLMLSRNVMRDFARVIQAERPGVFLPSCIGVELAPQGRAAGRSILHFHAMIGGVWSEDDRARLEAYWAYTRGWARAKSVSDAGGCVKYCAKHLLKRGAADNFDFQLVPCRAFLSRHDKRVIGSAR
jgi:hypothetical protein